MGQLRWAIVGSGIAAAVIAIVGFLAIQTQALESPGLAGQGGGEGAAGATRESAVLVSREVGGNEAITATVRRVGDEVLDQPGHGPDLSGLKGKVLVFAIALDTHDGDISTLDLNGKLFIRDSAGVEMPGMVRQLSVSTHHTTYVAAVPRLDSRGQPLDDPSEQRLIIVIKGVGSLSERVLEWKL